MKVRELLRRLERDGWRMTRMQGDRRQRSHLSKRGIITVAGNLGRDVPVGTLKAVLKAAGLEEQER